MIMKKICKECGKEFEATDGRQKYCTRQHFRPCPVCGKLIEVIYLSNPTPKCSECGKHRIRKPKPKQIRFSLSDPESVTTAILEVGTNKTVDTTDKMKITTAKISVFAEDVVTVTDKIVVEPTKTTSTKAELSIHSDEYVTRKYTGRTTCGFTHNHIYTVGLVSNNPYGYIVHAIADQTANDDLNIGLCIASLNSWEYFFKSV